MTSEERISIMRKRLQEKFHPNQMEIIDDSHLHVGHAGAKGGAGHYTLHIQADYFQGKNRIAIHREIYAELADLIPEEIHALRIKVI